MTTHSQNSQESGIVLPITTAFKHTANYFSNLCPCPEKAEQVRHNTLAVCAVNAYLQLMEIPTDLAKSDSWQPVMQVIADVADLKVPGVGILSCRALLPEDEVCYIPPEAWHHRTGYVAVILNEVENKATLVGFMPTVNSKESVALSQFSPMESLIDHIHKLQIEAASSVPSPPVAPPVLATQAQVAITQLSGWVEGVILSGWRAADELISPTDMNSFAFRTTAELAGVSPVSRSSATDISRAKLIDLGLQLGQSVRVALVVHLTQTTASQTDIILQVRPLGDSPYLDEGLVLSIFDEDSQLVMSATSRAIDNYIQIQLTGQPGELFSVHVNLKTATFAERFVI